MRDFNEVAEVFQLICQGVENTSSRHLPQQARIRYLQGIVEPQAIIKVAFDTRRIDQETEYNPRRGLQNYHRSQQFVSENMTQKINNFAKLKRSIESLKEKHGKEPEWQDSYARILLSSLNKGLRTEQQDGDFTDNQPGMGSLDYIEELLHVRYRLGFDQLTTLGEKELADIIIAKDENITHKSMYQGLISKGDIASINFDGLLEKLFREVRATSDNPEIERSITIIVKDKITKRAE